MPTYNLSQMIRELINSFEFTLRYLSNQTDDLDLKNDLSPLQTELKNLLDRIDV